MKKNMKKGKYTIDDAYYLLVENIREFSRLFGDGKNPYPLIKIPRSSKEKIKRFFAAKAK